MNFTVIKPNKRMNVNKLTSNNIRNSTSSGTRISSKPRKKMPKHLVNLKIDTPNRSRAIDRPSRKSFPSHSNLVQCSWISKKYRQILRSKRSIRRPMMFNRNVNNVTLQREKST